MTIMERAQAPDFSRGVSELKADLLSCLTRIETHGYAVVERRITRSASPPRCRNDATEPPSQHHNRSTAPEVIVVIEGDIQETFTVDKPKSDLLNKLERLVEDTDGVNLTGRDGKIIGLSH